MKDTLKTLGATNLSKAERSKLDYYGTDPASTEALLKEETFDGEIWEPCAGHHMISNVLEKHGYKVRFSDIAEYEGYEHEIFDFLSYNSLWDKPWDGNIITNPPYNLATPMIEKALSILQPGKKLAMFLRLQYLEGQDRYERIFKDNPPKTVYIFVNRQTSSKDDNFSVGSAVAYIWLVWQKNQPWDASKPDPVIKWIKSEK